MSIAESVGRLLRSPRRRSSSVSASSLAHMARSTLDRGTAVTPREVAGLVTEGVRVIDVREPREWAVGHLPGSRNVPLDVIDPMLVPHEAPFVLVCRNGYRAGLAARTVAALGVDEGFMFVLDGGLEAWRSDGRDLENRDLRDGRLV